MRATDDKARPNQGLLEKYQRLVEALKDDLFLYAHDTNGIFTYVSPSVTNILGYSQEEYFTHYADVFTDDPVNKVSILHTEQSMLGRRQPPYEIECFTRDGDIRRLEVREVPVFASDGSVLGVEGIALDITERKRAEDKLAATERKYRELFDEAPVMYVITHHENGSAIIEACNETFLESVGYTRDQAVGRPLEDFYAVESQTELLEGGYEAALEGRLAEQERQLLTRDGKIIETLMRAVPTRDAQGNVTGTRAAYVDISWRKQTMLALLDSEERYRRFFEEDLTGDFVTNPDGEIVACNPAFARIFGFDSVQEALEADASILYPDSSQRDELLRLLKKNEKLERLECELRRIDGKPLHVIENTIGVFDEDGELVQIRGYIFDVTEQRVLESQLRQSQKMDAVGQLAGGVAHDFNNLLTGIAGFTELASARVDQDSPAFEDLQRVIHYSGRAAQLTQHLLAFSRQQPLEPVTLDLNAVVEKTSSLLRRLIRENIEIRITAAEDLGLIRADPGQIDQILVNLAVNASDAMPDGGQFVVETANASLNPESASIPVAIDEGDYVHLSISDTGIGMDRDTQERIFEPFFSTKEVGHGTGLGLATVYGIVKQHEGFVWVDSEPGHGSRFEIYFPRVYGRVTEVVDPISFEASPGGSETVLLVEDEEAVRNVVERSLADDGYSVLAAASPVEAEVVFADRSDEIDLLVTDLVMPGESGLDLYDRLSAHKPSLKVLCMSGYAGKSEVRSVLSGRGRAFVKKPFTLDELGHAVRTLLDE